MTPTVNSSTAAPRNRPIRWSPDYNKNKSQSNWTEAQTSQKILQEKKKKKERNPKIQRWNEGSFVFRGEVNFFDEIVELRKTHLREYLMNVGPSSEFQESRF